MACTRNLSTEPKIRWQNLLEVIVVGMRIKSVRSASRMRALSSLIGTLFAFIATSNLLSFSPAMRHPPVPFPQLPHWQFVYSLPFPLRMVGQGPYRIPEHFAEPSLFIMPFHY
jgi:F0F1-type ATP synthase membrane subunit a